MNNYYKNKKCSNCKKLITNNANRYGSCAMKNRLKNPKNHPKYIDNRTNIQHRCEECGNKITCQAIKCKCCGNKRKFTKIRKINISIGTKRTMQRPEVKEKMSGKNNPCYIHGNGYKGYSLEFRKIRDKIRQRDSFTCQNLDCNCTQEEHFKKYGKDIEVHHIDYNKDNNDKDNLITLCKKCNINANWNRDYWYAYYKYIIENYINLD